MPIAIPTTTKLVRGPNNFKGIGNTAFLHVGDTSHPIEAIFERGIALAIGAYLHPQAVFIADFTGDVGIGTTTPTSGNRLRVRHRAQNVGLSTRSSGTPLPGPTLLALTPSTRQEATATLILRMAAAQALPAREAETVG
jgi:hypothetical protein